ncbi:MAG: branched-chain amino acid ABC transporter permease [Pseudomonadota bacterium]
MQAQMDLLIQLLVRGLLTGCVYALLGVSWGIIYNTTRTFHFAHGLIYTLSAYVTLMCVQAGLPAWPALLAGLAAAALSGCVIERLGYKPMRAKGASQLTIFLASMGILIAGQSLIQMLCGPDSRPFSLLGEVTLNLGPVTVTNLDMLGALGSLAAMGSLGYFLKRTKAGMMIRAVASNPEKAVFIGLDSNRVFMQVYAIGSLLMGLASLLTLLERPATTQIGLGAVLMAFITVFMGGVGSLLGAALGGFILGLVESLVLLFLPTEYKMVVTFAILFLVIIIKPEGLLGEKA